MHFHVPVLDFVLNKCWLHWCVYYLLLYYRQILSPSGAVITQTVHVFCSLNFYDTDQLGGVPGSLHYSPVSWECCALDRAGGQRLPALCFKIFKEPSTLGTQK